MGYGDFKLLAALGAWFGWQALPRIILLVVGGGRGGRHRTDGARAPATRGADAVRSLPRGRRAAHPVLRAADRRILRARLNRPGTSGRRASRTDRDRPNPPSRPGPWRACRHRGTQGLGHALHRPGGAPARPRGRPDRRHRQRQDHGRRPVRRARRRPGRHRPHRPWPDRPGRRRDAAPSAKPSATSVIAADGRLDRAAMRAFAFARSAGPQAPGTHPAPDDPRRTRAGIELAAAATAPLCHRGGAAAGRSPARREPVRPGARRRLPARNPDRARDEAQCATPRAGRGDSRRPGEPREQRLAAADDVVDNDGSPDTLPNASGRCTSDTWFVKANPPATAG
jgi:hypothetical protein